MANSWIFRNWWWLLPSVLAVFILVIYLISVFKKMEEKPAVDEEKLDRIIGHLGGIGNITETSKDGTRLKFVVTDLKKCDLKTIKDEGVQGIFVSGKQVKFQYPEASEALIKKIEAGKKEDTK